MTEATDVKDNLDMSAADIRDQASEELCKSLLESLLLQIKQLKKPWEEMTKAEQDTVIEALRKNVLTATKCAVRLIAGNGAITVAGGITVNGNFNVIYINNIDTTGRRNNKFTTNSINIKYLKCFKYSFKSNIKIICSKMCFT